MGSVRLVALRAAQSFDHATQSWPWGLDCHAHIADRSKRVGPIIASLLRPM
jgi:hypothetical protein